jgi:hypothetical protein
LCGLDHNQFCARIDDLVALATINLDRARGIGVPVKLTGDMPNGRFELCPI